MTRGAHLRRSSLVTRDGALVFTGRVVRTFSLGALSLALPLLLKHRGLSAAALGGVLTATLVEDALLTAAVTAMAPRWGRRRLLILSASDDGGVHLYRVADLPIEVGDKLPALLRNAQTRECQHQRMNPEGELGCLALSLLEALHE